jgi:2-oxo-4-hydroxy-4-carboxy--5-ureidoimidazoline (OHCU) decarboxylase
MAAARLPPIADVPRLSSEDRIAILDALFEPVPQLHALSVDLLHTQRFTSYGHLITTIGGQLDRLAESQSTSDTEWLDQILCAHPRLGAKKVDSAQSRAEQARLNQGAAEEASQLAALNAEYEKTFPGLIYV